MTVFELVCRMVAEGKLTPEEATVKLALVHDQYESKRKAGNRTFSHLMKVRHRFGEGEKREYSTRLHRPAIFSRMSRYGI